MGSVHTFKEVLNKINYTDLAKVVFASLILQDPDAEPSNES